MSNKETRSTAYYLDDDHNFAAPDKATQVVINEFDENGVMIRETWGFVNHVARKGSHRKHESTCWLKRLLHKD